MGNKSRTATSLILLGVFFWGLSFIFVKEAMARTDVYSFLTVRFTIATAILAIVFIRHFRFMSADLLRNGLLTGLVLALSFVFQTLSMKYTSASNSAFITGLAVVLVPLFGGLLDREFPGGRKIASALLAFGGLALLTLRLPFKTNIGDFWALLCAVGFAMHIIIIQRVGSRYNAPAFTVVQLSVVAVMSCAAGVFTGGINISGDPVVWRSILFCAVFATAYIFVAQTHYQKYITEIKMAIIVSFEPLFAAIAAFIYLHEKLPFHALVGGAMIYVGMVLSEVKKKPV